MNHRFSPALWISLTGNNLPLLETSDLLYTTYLRRHTLPHHRVTIKVVTQLSTIKDAPGIYVHVLCAYCLAPPVPYIAIWTYTTLHVEQMLTSWAPPHSLLDAHIPRSCTLGKQKRGITSRCRISHPGLRQRHGYGGQVGRILCHCGPPSVHLVKREGELPTDRALGVETNERRPFPFFCILSYFSPLYIHKREGSSLLSHAKIVRSPRARGAGTVNQNPGILPRFFLFFSLVRLRRDGGALSAARHIFGLLADTMKSPRQFLLSLYHRQSDLFLIFFLLDTT
ncbi:hypothetical protein F5X99DRAFT_87874 [Biscogniauxia marginata]|nr:hypothetical protein F5X99DRAFT_87874 [Biscogniauxia marginata]